MAGNAFAAEIPDALDVQNHLNSIWTIIAACLVFIMLAGFTLMESGLTRAKNASNVIMKTIIGFSIGAFAYWAIGFGLMFGESSSGLFGSDGFFLTGFAHDGDYQHYSFWMLQLLFCSIVALIISGAMAERTRFIAHLIYTAALAAIIYPVFGSWAWGSMYHGNGWLESLGFIDFAGSTVVHSVGGWAALAGAIAIGPRNDKFGKDGVIKALPGHNLPLAAIGVMILWFGWYGFNTGNAMVGDGDIALIVINTTLAAVAGTVVAMVVAWMRYGLPDVGTSLNGAMAGLVGIAAGCASLSPLFAIITGAVAGVLVVVFVPIIERFKVDDPVGAISVHGVCGAWGTLAVGLFNSAEMFSLKIISVQLIGIAACFLWVFPTTFLLLKAIDRFSGLRVSAEDEYNGLDFSEHGANSYPDSSLGSFR